MPQEHPEDFLYDVRLIERHIARGLLTRAAVKSYDDARRDVAAQADMLNLDQMAANAATRRPRQPPGAHAMAHDSVSDPSARSSSFKVVDRRRFTAGGEVRPGGAAALEEDRRRPIPTLAAPAPVADQTASVGAAPQRNASTKPQAPRRSQVDFMAFVASLATNAMGALGLMPEGQAANFTRLISDLRLNYVEVTRADQSSGQPPSYPAAY